MEVLLKVGKAILGFSLSTMPGRKVTQIILPLYGGIAKEL